VDRAGLRPTYVGDLPAQCAALDRAFLNVAELTVLAALEESREHVLQAMLLDPNCAASLSVAQIEDLRDEMLAAEAAYLPPGLRPH
jgi:alpha-galactosidase